MDASLPNGSCGDSLLHVRLPLIGRGVAFDAGDTRRIPARDLLRLSHVFISHCHIDHFVGFDAMVRPRVCRQETMGIAGPPGFLDRLQARLGGYTWNLVDGNHFTLVAREILPDRIRVASFDSGCEFRREDMPDEPPGAIPFEDIGLVAESVALDHHVVSLGWAIQAPPRVNVREDVLVGRGLPPGRWLADLKRRAMTDDRADRFELPDGSVAPLGEVADALLDVARGTRIAYVTDTICDAATRPRIVRLAAGADVFACGAPFLQSESAERARATRHLTAAQAGEMAAEASVRTLLLFHVSDRHGQDPRQHAEEAREAAGGRVEVLTQPAAPIDAV